LKSNLYSIFVFLICLLVTYLASTYYQQKQLIEIREDVNSESQNIAHTIQGQLLNSAGQLLLTVQGWRSTAEIDKYGSADIENLKHLIPYINDITIYHPAAEKPSSFSNATYLGIQNVFPKTQQNKYRNSLPARAKQLKNSKLFMSQPFILSNNESAVYLHIPIIIEQHLFAYLQVTYNLSRLLKDKASSGQLHSPFSLSENGVTLFSILPEATRINQVSKQFYISVFGHNWKLMAWSKKQASAYLHILYMGFLISLLLPALIYASLNNEKLQLKIKARDERLKKLHLDIKANQSKLVHSNKLSSLGEIATGIAHEINQPLQVICIHADLCSENLIKENYQQVNKNFCAIISQVDRIEKIVKQVGSFGRDSEADNYKNEEPADIFNNVMNIVINQYKQENVELRSVLPTSLPHIFCNKTQIEQVLVNLLINAKDAVEHSATKVVFIKAHNQQNKLYIEISDSGLGIEEDKLDKIFVPFYTTKALGKGTGLGLSISYSIIQQHNGKLKVSSELGKGSTFTLVLPHSATA